MIKNFIVVTCIFSVCSFATASDFPDRVTCIHPESSYKLVLVLKDPKLPIGVTAVGLKNGDSVVFKVATTTYSDEADTLSFVQIPATLTSKLVKLFYKTKIAKVLNFELPDLEDSSEFICEF